MQYSKSDTLDELRYQIGRYGDQVFSAYELIKNVNTIIVGEQYIYEASHVYTCEEDGFYLLTKAGVVPAPGKIPFGNNVLSLCAVRGNRVISEEDGRMRISIPSYRGHYLLGCLVIYAHKQHGIDQDDIDFLEEVTEYVKNRLVCLGMIR